MQIERRRYTKAHISIAPMIDVVFLLLLFFMLTSNLVKEPSIKISLPDSKTGTTSGEQLKTLIVTNDKKLYFDGEQLILNELADVLNNYRTVNPLEKVSIKADRGVEVGRLIRIVDEVRLAGITQFHVVTERGAQQ